MAVTKRRMGDSELNHKVYKFAHSHIRQFVGARRQCWDLADRALHYAGAAFTAIVATYKAPGRVVVLEQNFPEGQPVRQHIIELDDSAPVVKTTFRSVKDDRGNMRHAKVAVTSTVRVTGQVRAYRPKVKK